MGHQRLFKEIDSGVRKAFGHNWYGLFLRASLPLALILCAGCERPALIVAAEQGNCAEIVRLLSAGADINQREGGYIRGITPLHAVAEKSGSVDAVRLLLKAGADIHAIAFFNSTPLMLALYSRHWEVAKILIEAEKPSDRKQVLGAALLTVAQGGNSMPFEDFNDYDNSMRFHAEVLKFLIECGADVNARTAQGDTALHLVGARQFSLAVTLGGSERPWARGIYDERHPPPYTLSITMQGNIYAAYLLVKHGANLDARNDAGLTPYQVAVGAGNQAIADILAPKTSVR